ncbi:MAG: UDP-N-acetylmuramoyl-L-alanine--D-glutamate ligase [Candidatus Omnitrophica bacterium]|jgi:UDP-N-acetylmuramoylalanine--D-glutamate ligase|nr:UDP-N-acetylmuramoyl-L-alanine--D-glutamate ligase [Candidatus Omnitrophota bacterium]
MRNSGYFKNKKITIIGFARSGLACANLLYSLGAKVRVSDSADNQQTSANILKLKSLEIQVELGRHSRDFVIDSDLIVASPGVPAGAEPFIWAKQLGIPVISEIEVASILCPAEIIAVTGSNGKTTVTTLIGLMLKACGKRAFVCGNIGNPFSAVVESIQPEDYLVLEVSSFQLETIREFKPRIALILNVTLNHLDHYNNMQEYALAKQRIFINQDKDDFLLLGSADPALENLPKLAKANVVFFKKEPGLDPNQAAVLCVGKILKLDEKTVRKVFQEFSGIEHRMEFVALINGVRFINDSKATTVDSALWAINNITSPIVLIAGGRDKGVDYNLIIKEAAAAKIKQAILLGEAKTKIAAAFDAKIKTEQADSLENAVKAAFAKACPGECVLFSPMCSSFDMFKDYEERGREFKRIVLELAKRK